jgi:hypothetical protein
LTANLGGNGTYIDLNGKTVSLTADKDYTVGYVLGENEDLVITAGKTAEGTANWIHFDNFRLQFCGDVAAALTTLIEQKTNYSGVVPNAVYTQLLSDVEAYDKNYSDVDELLAAIDAVQALYNAADAFKAPYAAFNALKAKANTLQAVENTNAEANSTLATAITTQTAAAEAATTASAIEIATSTLKNAMIAYVGVADPTSGNRFDLTFMLTNPDLTGLPTWKKADGWYTDQEDGNSQVMTNDGVKTDDGKNAFYEYWSETAKANGEFTLYQKVNLTPGTYAIKCYAFSDQPVGGNNRAVYFYANDTQGSLVNNNKLTEQGISFINEETQDVKIGLKALSGNNYRWMGIGYVELYKEYTDNTTYEINVGSVSNASVAVTVDGEEATSAKALKTVTLTFTPDAGYVVSSVTAKYNDGEEKAIDVANPSANVYTFQMPAYDVNVSVSIIEPVTVAISSAGLATFASDYALDFTGSNVKAYSATISGSTITFKRENKVPAGEGVLLKAEEGEYKIPVATGVVAWEDDNAFVRGTGANVPSVDGNNRNYVLANAQQGVGFYLANGLGVADSKAYLQTTATTDARLSFVFSDETTGINAVQGAALAVDGEVYNLNGQRVATPKRGLYIQNGKKIIMK